MTAAGAPADGRDCGFTLLEVMIALLIAGLVMAGLTAAMRTINKGWGGAVASLSRQDAVDGALRVIAGDIARIERIVTREAARPAFEFRGSAGEMIYVLAERPVGGPGLYRIGLFLREDGQGRRLVRARARYRPGGEAAEWSDEAVLLRGDLALRLAYRAPRHGLRRWLDRWPEADRMPEQVRLELIERGSGVPLAPPLIQALRISAEAACADSKSEACTLQTRGQLQARESDGE